MTIEAHGDTTIQPPWEQWVGDYVTCVNTIYPLNETEVSLWRSTKGQYRARTSSGTAFLLHGERSTSLTQLVVCAHGANVCLLFCFRNLFLERNYHEFCFNTRRAGHDSPAQHTCPSSRNHRPRPRRARCHKLGLLFVDHTLWRSWSTVSHNFLSQGLSFSKGGTEMTVKTKIHWCDITVNPTTGGAVGHSF